MAHAALGSSWSVRAAAGEPFAVVRVKNLQTVVQAGQDAWGRPSIGQPLLVSVEVSFSKPFHAAASSDSLGNDTAHYGNLSKAILASIEAYRPANLASLGEPPAVSLHAVLGQIWQRLTGTTLDGRIPGGSVRHEPFLSLGAVRFLSVDLHLPKASLLGDGISATASSVYETVDGKPLSKLYSYALRLRSLRVPTLIGVNAIERQSKQIVIASIELDKLDCHEDIHAALETLIVKELDSSSFQTLEALGARLSEEIRDGLVSTTGRQRSEVQEWLVRISLAKPTAVTFADYPVVEFVTGPSGH